MAIQYPYRIGQLQMTLFRSLSELREADDIASCQIFSGRCFADQPDRSPATLEDPSEVLPQNFTQLYLTGFLVPTDAGERQRCDPTSHVELDQKELLASARLSENKQAAKQHTDTKPKRARKKTAEGQKGLEFDHG
jgi:hypothetical protein